MKRYSTGPVPLDASAVQITDVPGPTVDGAFEVSGNMLKSGRAELIRTARKIVDVASAHTCSISAATRDAVRPSSYSSSKMRNLRAAVVGQGLIGNMETSNEGIPAARSA